LWQDGAVLTTARLILRPWRVDDLPDLAAMLQDPVAMVAYQGPFSDQEVRAWLDRQLDNYTRHGYGLWAMQSRASGQVVGQCGLTWQDIDSARCLEVGYHVKRAFWHQGYATEAGLACRDYAWDTLGLPEVFAQVRDTNLASMNVAIRLGMTIRSRFVKRYRGVDMAHYAFSVRSGDRAGALTTGCPSPAQAGTPDADGSTN
jgi:RimJ/RimL family protein N-acetyltransferase